jgi:regulator of sirC expression with transglutaminase-like and TPR domain
LTGDLYRQFRQAIDRVEHGIDLGRAALTIALPEYPDLEIEACLARLDEFALEATGRCDPDADVCPALVALQGVLYERHGFRGNEEDYYDPRNSFLNEVLERKRGIPITLSVLYMEVARRAGVIVEGIGFPGHFLVKHTHDAREFLIDPFHRGVIRSPDDLRRLLNRLSGGSVPLRSEFLKTAGKREILRRMLGNLRAIYLKDADWAKLLAVLDQLIILDPAAADQFRDRGDVYLRVGLFSSARADLEHYLRLAPEASDVAEIRDQLVSLVRRVTVIH